MSRIEQGRHLVTLINVFTVEPARQGELLRVLADATETVMRHQPGFVSANLHTSLDGDRVVNYAQWRSGDDFEAMQRNPTVAPHMAAAAAIATSFEPRLYDVAFVDEQSEGTADA